MSNPYGNPYEAGPSNYGIEPYSDPGTAPEGSSGPDYTGTVPPPPGATQGPAVAQPGYSIRPVTPANALGLPLLQHPAVKHACSFAFQVVVGAAVAKYLVKRPWKAALLSGVAGAMAAGAVKPLAHRFGPKGAFACWGIAAAGGWAASKWLFRK